MRSGRGGLAHGATPEEPACHGSGRCSSGWGGGTRVTGHGCGVVPRASGVAGPLREGPSPRGRRSGGGEWSRGSGATCESPRGDGTGPAYIGGPGTKGPADGWRRTSRNGRRRPPPGRGKRRGGYQRRWGRAAAPGVDCRPVLGEAVRVLGDACGPGPAGGPGRGRGGAGRAPCSPVHQEWGAATRRDPSSRAARCTSGSGDSSLSAGTKGHLRREVGVPTSSGLVERHHGGCARKKG